MFGYFPRMKNIEYVTVLLGRVSNINQSEVRKHFFPANTAKIKSLNSHVGYLKSL